MPALAASTAAKPQTTQTTLLVDSRDVNGHTEATISIAVTGADGLPATGSVTINDDGKPLAGFALDARGEATETLSLAGGWAFPASGLQRRLDARSVEFVG